MRRVIAIAFAVLFLAGCAHVISKDVLKEVDRKIAFAELKKDPLSCQGKQVVLGGIIVKTENKQDGTLIEVYQTGMDRSGKPVKLDVSGGRFLAFYNDFLDSEIYRRDRRVTIAGVVQGERVMKLGDIDYHYPYIIIRDLHLWKEEMPLYYRPYPWGWYDPWWGGPWYPWTDPYWRWR